MSAIQTIGLLVVSNIFMTFAWYGHVKLQQVGAITSNTPLYVVILLSWLLALAEYACQVPANRFGYLGNGGSFSLMQLKIIQEVAAQNPTFLSGTADLASSTKTTIANENRYSCEDYSGRNLYFGIREFAMVAIMNGMTLHKGVKIAAGGFLVFSDYFKAAARMA